jgi:hypothetical protein
LNDFLINNPFGSGEARVKGFDLRCRALLDPGIAKLDCLSIAVFIELVVQFSQLSGEA